VLGVAGFGHVFEMRVPLTQEGTHVPREDERVHEAPHRAERRLEGERVDHPRPAVPFHELVDMVEIAKGAPDEFVDEPVWPIKLRDPHGQALPDAEMDRLPGHDVAACEQASRDAADRAFSCLSRRVGMSIDATCQVETALDGGIDLRH